MYLDRGTALAVTTPHDGGSAAALGAEGGAFYLPLRECTRSFCCYPLSSRDEVGRKARNQNDDPRVRVGWSGVFFVCCATPHYITVGFSPDLSTNLNIA